MSILFASASGQYIEGTNFVYSPSLKNVNGATLCAWIYANSIPYDPSTIVVVSTDDYRDSRAKLSVFSSGAISGRGRCKDGDSVQIVNSSAGDISTGVTYHVAAVFDYSAETIALYRNGVQLTSGSASGWGGAPTSNTDSTLTMIGGHTLGTEWWNGYTGDVRIYNRVLTAAELLSIYGARGGDSIFYGLQNRYRCLSGIAGSDVNPEPDFGIGKYNLTRASASRPDYNYSTLLSTCSRRQRGC